MFDNRSLLRASSFMDIAQELAVQGSFQLGFADRQLAPYNVVWILARMHVKFNSLPPMYSSVTAETWSRGQLGLCHIRDYRLLGDNGESLIDGTSSWVLMEKTKRAIVRPNSLGDAVDCNPQNTDFAIEEPAERILLPKDFHPRSQISLSHVVFFVFFPEIAKAGEGLRPIPALPGEPGSIPLSTVRFKAHTDFLIIADVPSFIELFETGILRNVFAELFPAHFAVRQPLIIRSLSISAPRRVLI